MTQLDSIASSEMVFTLSDEDDFSPDLAQTDWERSLKELRNRHAEQPEINTLSMQDIAVATSHEHTHTQASQVISSMPDVPMITKFGDQELDAAYREFLRQTQNEHNAHVQSTEEDVGILLQEDWLNAQTALQSEHNRRHLTESKTVILKGKSVSQSNAISLSLEADASAEVHEDIHLPTIAVHVYDLPKLPSTRRICVLSERELMQAIQDRLKPHLSNIVAGMVRQAIQKKMATLSYDLQTMLNEETPRVVQEVLEHNLHAIFRTVKDSLSDKK